MKNLHWKMHVVRMSEFGANINDVAEFAPAFIAGNDDKLSGRYFGCSLSEQVTSTMACAYIQGWNMGRSGAKWWGIVNLFPDEK